MKWLQEQIWTWWGIPDCTKTSSKQTHTQRFRKAFSALIQRTEAFNFRKYKIGLDFFSPQIVSFPFPMKCCCSLLFKQLELKHIPSLTLDMKDGHRYFSCFWLRIRPFLEWHFNCVLFWFKCPQCRVTPCPADPEMSCYIHILHPCSPHKNEVQGRAKFRPK